MRIIKKITRTVKALWYANSYVTLDYQCDFIRFSRRLFRLMEVEYREDLRLVCFKTSEGHFGFCFASDVDDFPKDKETCDICTVGRKVGFFAKTLNVATILYDYGLPHDLRCRLSVHPVNVGKMKTFIIMPPHSPQQE